MATEADWFRVIDEQTRSIGPRPSIGLQLVEQALAEHPRSCRLWNRRGDLIQLLEDDVPSYSLADARMSYETACAVDPLDPEAYESLGFFFDAVDEHLDEAERMFRKEIRLPTRLGPAFNKSLQPTSGGQF